MVSYKLFANYVYFRGLKSEYMKNFCDSAIKMQTMKSYNEQNFWPAVSKKQMYKWTNKQILITIFTLENTKL